MKKEDIKIGMRVRVAVELEPDDVGDGDRYIIGAVTEGTVGVVLGDERPGKVQVSFNGVAWAPWISAACLAPALDAPDDTASPSLEKGAEAAALRAEHEDTGPHEGCSCATCRAARGPSAAASELPPKPESGPPPTQPYRAGIPSMTLREQADCARWSPDDYTLGVVPQRGSCPQCGMGACMHERPVDRLE